MPVYGVIDVGTNSVKFRLGERREDGSWHALVDRAEVTRLGEGLSKEGSFTPAAMKRTVDAVAEMAKEAEQYQASSLVAVGTMGLRVARNTDSFLAAVRDRCGVDVEVISSNEEARLAYLAAVSGLDIIADTIVVFDTGGGSTQFTVGRGRLVEEQFSLDLGAVRLTEQFGLDHHVPQKTLKRALEVISQELGRLDHVAHPDALVGMGGAITNMTAVMYGLAAYDPERVQGALLTTEEVERQIDLYRRHDGSERRRIAGLQPRRAEVILAGACVVRTVMAKLGRDALFVSDRGLRHGLLLDRFG